MSKTLYEVIGVSPNADIKEIEIKCIELGKKHHPNNNPDDLDAAIVYKDLMLAYSTLRDPAKRAAYDATIKANQIASNPPKNGNNAANAQNKNLSKVEVTGPKEVSLFFAVAIVFAPFIAAWFLLQKGYSTKARVISFAWLLLFTWVYFKPAPTPEQKARMQASRMHRQQAEELEQKQKDRVNRVMGTWKSAISDILIDPSSADFKDVIFVTAISGTSFACGEVNSKNRLGGYTGYKSFITAGLKEYTYIEGETKGFNEFWNEICVNGQQL